ncbi:MAG: hypothetical protein H6712_27595 [Myxococcales bacterium]|nr:hypothetical protein [Myxococcales bacterium]MCB9717643.1 hypothetical protein [Myxococcales bacterium]
MLGISGSTNVDFLPDEDARAWVADGLRDHMVRLGEPARRARVVTKTTIDEPRDLDDLFELMCGVQREVGQGEVELTLLELTEEDSPARHGYEPLGDPTGQLMHTFAKRDDLVVVVVPQLLRVAELTLASVARELGRIAVYLAGGHQVEPSDVEGDAELAAITLGLGVWIANGAYVYENACCGGGCGLDLRSMRAGLSMPEACFGLAVDSQRKGISRRAVAKHLQPNQRAAFKRSWGYVGKQPALTAAPQMAALGS